tara:strand:+ start:1492 stop:2037 length:546 start_codon:yes stop_codon:yes gene_type:complete
MTRLFIALTPTVDFNKEISSLKESQKALKYKNVQINWSNNNQHHVTVNFIGAMEPEQKEEMFNILDSRPPFKSLPIEINNLSYFPNENGQVLVANISLTPRLQKLYDQVEEVVARIGFGMALRSYKPHITLARFKEKNRPFSELLLLEEPISFACNSLDVYESSFKGGKTIHSLIKSYSLE